MGLVKGDCYTHVDCDIDGCPEWRRLSEPKPLGKAIVEIMAAGWLVVYVDGEYKTFCQGHHREGVSIAEERGLQWT